MFEVLGYDTIKPKILPHSSVSKRSYASKSQLGEHSFNTFFTS